MASDTGRQFMETGGANPLKSIRAIRTPLAPVVQPMTEDAYAASRDANALICLDVDEIQAFQEGHRESQESKELVESGYGIEPYALVNRRGYEFLRSQSPRPP
jgi:hypothetical protein